MSYVPIDGAEVTVSSGNVYVKTDDSSLGADVLPMQTRDDRVITVLNNIDCKLEQIIQRMDIVFDID